MDADEHRFYCNIPLFRLFNPPFICVHLWIQFFHALHSAASGEASHADIGRRRCQSWSRALLIGSKSWLTRLRTAACCGLGSRRAATRESAAPVIAVIGDLPAIFQALAEHSAHEQRVVGDVTQNQGFACAAGFDRVIAQYRLPFHKQSGDGFDRLAVSIVERKHHVHPGKAREQFAHVIHERRLYETLFHKALLNVAAKNG